MKDVSSWLGLIAGVALLTSAAAGQAQTLSPQGAITATGVVNVGLKATTVFDSVCEVVFQGVADASGITLTSATGSQVSGPIDCTGDGGGIVEGWVFPIRANVTPDRQLRFENIGFSMRFGDCQNPNVVAAWDSADSRIDVTADKTFCRLSGVLTVSPATIIN
ncbi:hypothetical protein [Brevundimonas faecalis]|uniref:Protein activator of alkane oxidation PraB n=1 Tax=Brevundimonas faecalis TaxID=947378 RepID=A0ABV2R8D7_9CAUL